MARILQAALFLKDPSQDELDLPVQAPQLIVCPPLKRRENRRIDAEQERFPICHKRLSGAACRR